MTLTEEVDPAEKLLRILERNLEILEVDMPDDLLFEIAKLQQQNQFDDDRSKTRKAMRDLIEHHAKQVALQETKSNDVA